LLKHHYPMKGLVRQPELQRCQVLEILRFDSSLSTELSTRKGLQEKIRNIFLKMEK
jgi:hypothetical protein